MGRIQIADLLKVVVFPLHPNELLDSSSGSCGMMGCRLSRGLSHFQCLAGSLPALCPCGDKGTKLI